MFLGFSIAAVPSPALAIINGVADPDDPAVVSLPGCTGTLIAPQVVITAGHCVFERFPQELWVAMGPTRMTGPVANVLEIRFHPLYDRHTEDYDLALLYIDPPFTDVAPIPVLSMPFDNSMIGTSLRIVGYGVSQKTDPSTEGTKRQGTTRLAAYLYAAFTDTASPEATCNGDSGGPALATVNGTEYLAGITSRGDDACATFGVKTRIDPFVADFIHPYVAATSPDGTQIGGFCASDMQCAGVATCVRADDDPIVRYCSVPCEAASGCPTDMTCDRGMCRYPAPTPSAVGAPCTRNADCASTLCAHASAQAPLVCTTQCQIGGIGCNRGFECLPDARGDGTHVCIPETAESSSGCAVGFDGAGRGGHYWLPAIAVILVLRCRRQCQSSQA
ncbi:MAG TPA: trypsin-like serine protease [Kofleriaceae bacterium]|nr:trypsin-like serine protease [Kofleriaceae bacterium]